MTPGLPHKPFWWNIALLLASCLVCLLVVEAALRVLVPPELQPAPHLFMSRPALQDQETAFWFKENARIREAAVYWTGKGWQIEYDTVFTTNNLGLVQKQDVQPRKAAIVLVGDSFLQGNGAEPWFYCLEAQWPGNRLQLVNLGLLGTGVEQWGHMLQWFAARGKIEHIFICFISQDWERRRWVARETPAGDGFQFIPWSQRHQADTRGQLTVHYIDENASPGELIRQAELIRQQAPAGIAPAASWLRSYELLKSTYRNLTQTLPLNEHVAANKKHLLQMVADFGRNRVTLFHIPQKGEIILGGYSPLGQQVKEFIASQHLAYIDGLALCGLTREDYHTYDAHPNARGYQKIYHCLLTHGLNRLYPPEPN